MRGPGAAFRVAILDPALTLTTPRAVTAATGYDAIAHSVESFVSTKATPLSDVFAREAWRRLETNFERVLLQPEDVEARGAMLLGAHLAGLAIECSMLGATHACANPLSARYGTLHGIAIALLLPHVVRWNAGRRGGATRSSWRSPGAGRGSPRARSRTGWRRWRWRAGSPGAARGGSAEGRPPPSRRRGGAAVDGPLQSQAVRRLGRARGVRVGLLAGHGHGPPRTLRDPSRDRGRGLGTPRRLASLPRRRRPHGRGGGRAAEPPLRRLDLRGGRGDRKLGGYRGRDGVRGDAGGSAPRPRPRDGRPPLEV